MTQLHAIPPVLLRLFEDIDEAAGAQSTPVRQLVEAWHQPAGRDPAALLKNLAPNQRRHAFVVRRAPARRMPSLVVPSRVPASPPLSELDNPRLVVLLRRALDHVAGRGEPLLVRGRLRRADGSRAHFELYVTPGGGTGPDRTYLCALALRQPQDVWEA
jgi:hypothetical protein